MPRSRNLSGCQIFKETELPATWDSALLGTRIELAYGRGLREEERHPGDVDVYGSNGRVGSHDAALVHGSGILVGRKGTVGAVHYAPRAFWPIDTAYYVVPRAGDDRRFLYHLLRYLPLKFLNAATGVPGLSRRDAYALRGAFPSLDEQTAIARVLDLVELALEHARAAVEQAQALKRALVQRLFSDGLRGLAKKKTPIGLLPLTWEVMSVSAVVECFQYGLSVPMATKGDLPILRMGNISAGDVLLSDLKFVSLPAKVVAPYLLKRGDILFNRTNSQEWVGKVGIFRHDAPAVFASYLIRLLPDSTKIDNYYLGHVLGSYPAQCRIKRYATPGVQQVNINATNLGKVLIPVPMGNDGLREQHEIAALLESADSIVRSYEPALAAWQVIRLSLMHDLLTGRVRVCDSAMLVTS